MATFVLKAKTKSGQKIITGLNPENQISELKSKLSELTGISVEALQVLAGFPPKVIDLDHDQITIQKTGIVSGDTLIVEEKSIVCNGTKELEDVGRSHIIDRDLPNPEGVLIRKVVPSDNSCLFTSIGYVLNAKVDPSCASYMREIIANAVGSDPDEYSEAFLGKPNMEYCQWILKPDSWGGAIEVSILSRYYGLEIAVVDSINGIINRFGEDRHYPHRVFLIFDGIHYEPLYLEPLKGDVVRTIFSIKDEKILLEALELAKEAKSSRQFTDVQKFTLMCMDCRVKLNGQVAAQTHAKETGHTNFGEIST